MKALSVMNVLGMPFTPLQMALFTSELGEGAEHDRNFIKRYNASKISKGNKMANPNAIRSLAQKASSAIAKASPDLKDRALEYVRQATNGKVANLDQVQDFASKGKNAFAIVASGAVKAGINPEDLIDTAVINDLNDRDLTNLSTNLRNDFNQIYGAIDARTRLGISNTGDAAKLVLAKEVCEWAKRAGLGGNSLRETHAKLKLFTAMSDEEIGVIGTLYPHLK